MTQDMAGPITRWVADAAATLEVIEGYDPRDVTTEPLRGKELPRYASSLDKNGLRGARIGALRSFFGQKPEHAEVNRVVDAALARMKELGAEPVELSAPLDMDQLISGAPLRRTDADQARLRLRAGDAEPKAARERAPTRARSPLSADLARPLEGVPA